MLNFLFDRSKKPCPAPNFHPGRAVCFCKVNFMVFSLWPHGQNALWVKLDPLDLRGTAQMKGTVNSCSHRRICLFYDPAKALQESKPLLPQPAGRLKSCPNWPQRIVT